MRILTATVIAASLVAGCTSGKENVLFVTSTQIDIGYDTSVGNLNLGYDRNELMIGPSYVETGGLPPVAATIKSNLSIFQPKISQVYATGNAAIIATSRKDAVTDEMIGESCAKPDDQAASTVQTLRADWVGCSNKLVGPRQVAVFGTSSNFGLKVGYDASGATSVSLGYKRRELSVIPLQREAGRDPLKPDNYASVLGSIDIDTTIANPTDTKSELGQFFATGRAAEQLAAQDGVREKFIRGADAAVNLNLLMGAEVHKTASERTKAVQDCVQTGDQAYDDSAKSRLAQLADVAQLSGTANTRVRNAGSNAELRRVLMIQSGDALDPLYEAASDGGVACAG